MQRQHYPTDPTDTEWRYLISHFSTERARERPREHPLRQLLGAIFTSCAAVAPDVRLRTHGFPPGQTGFYWFRPTSLEGSWVSFVKHRGDKGMSLPTSAQGTELIGPRTAKPRK